MTTMVFLVSRPRAAAAILLGALFAFSSGVLAPAAFAAPARAEVSRPTSRTPVMGPNLLTPQQLARWYDHKRWGIPPRLPNLDHDIVRLARLFIEEGRVEGVRGDIAFVQSVLETGWFSFPSAGQIRPSFNNFAGMYAYNGRAPGTTCAAETAPSRCFSSPRRGVRTLIHLLRGYADATSADLPDRLEMPPGDRIGVAPIWEKFGGASGKAIWATAPDYGRVIIRLYSDALVYNGARAECLPYSPGGSGSMSGKGYWLVTSQNPCFPSGKPRSSSRPLHYLSRLRSWEVIPGLEGMHT